MGWGLGGLLVGRGGFLKDLFGGKVATGGGGGGGGGGNGDGVGNLDRIEQLFEDDADSDADCRSKRKVAVMCNLV